MPGVLPSQAHVAREPLPKALAPSVFNITGLSQAPDPKKKDGSTWRVLCVAVSDDATAGKNEKGRDVPAVGQGEVFLLLFAGNVVRDEQFEAFEAALESGNDFIGPCTLLTRKGIGSAMRDVTDVVDGTSALAAWRGTQADAPAAKPAR